LRGGAMQIDQSAILGILVSAGGVGDLISFVIFCSASMKAA
jgi:hypothetical protein